MYRFFASIRSPQGIELHKQILLWKFGLLFSPIIVFIVELAKTKCIFLWTTEIVIIIIHLAATAAAAAAVPSSNYNPSITF